MIEKNIVDRVPTYAGRIKLTPVSGQPDTFTMERADEPTVEGTPLDKATLDSIIQSRLTGRFYDVVATRAVLSNQAGITINPIPISGWIMGENANEYSSGGYKATASSSYSMGEIPYAFDGSNSNDWASGEGSTEWLQLEFPAQVKINKMQLSLGMSVSSASMTTTVQGSNNGTSWSNLYSTTDISKSVVEHTLTNPDYYKYYRLLFDPSTSSRARVYLWNVTHYDIVSFINDYASDYFPLKWDKGQVVTIQCQGDINNFGVTANTLNGVPVNTILQPSMRYELTYNGTAFDAKGV
jgi:hypothetical protein